jgi:hypothetical protein
LVPFAEGFRRELLKLGHTPATAKHHLDLMGQLNRWLSAEPLSVDKLSTLMAEAFLAARRARGQRRVPTLVSLAPLFDYLCRR